MVAKALVLKEMAHMDWVAFERSVHDRFGVNTVVLQKDGDRCTAEEIIWANKICERIKNHKKGSDRICDTLRRYLMHEAEVNKRFTAGECAAGMYRMIAPIIRNDEIEGFVSLCGRPFLSVDRIYTEYIHRTIGMDEETIKSLLPFLNPIGPRTIKEMQRFITAYAH